MNYVLENSRHFYRFFVVLPQYACNGVRRVWWGNFVGYGRASNFVIAHSIFFSVDENSTREKIYVERRSKSMSEPTDRKWMPVSWFVVDVESFGLHGEAFRVAWVLIGANTGMLISEGALHCQLEAVAEAGFVGGMRLEDIPTPHPISVECSSPREIRGLFWTAWLAAKDQGNTAMLADVPWPVESRFLARCVDDRPEARKFEGPYPLYDLASIMLGRGMDPLADHARLESEPKHCPLGDARHTARLLLAHR